MGTEVTTQRSSETVSRNPSPQDGDTTPAAPVEPFSSGFLDKSDTATKARTIYVTILLQRTCLIVVALLAIFSIYWGALWRIPARSLQGWIVVSLITFFSCGPRKPHKPLYLRTSTVIGWVTLSPQSLLPCLDQKLSGMSGLPVSSPWIKST